MDTARTLIETALRAASLQDWGATDEALRELVPVMHSVGRGVARRLLAEIRTGDCGPGELVVGRICGEQVAERLQTIARAAR